MSARVAVDGREAELEMPPSSSSSSRSVMNLGTIQQAALGDCSPTRGRCKPLPLHCCTPLSAGAIVDEGAKRAAMVYPGFSGFGL